jgi:hypothetical protein
MRSRKPGAHERRFRLLNGYPMLFWTWQQWVDHLAGRGPAPFE